MKTRVRTWGNSLGIRIPQALAKEVGLHEGSEVDLTVRRGTLVIEPKKTKYSLDELLAGITPENLPDPSDYDWGQPVGKEIW